MTRGWTPGNGGCPLPGRRRRGRNRKGGSSRRGLRDLVIDGFQTTGTLEGRPKARRGDPVRGHHTGPRPSERPRGPACVQVVKAPDAKTIEHLPRPGRERRTSGVASSPGGNSGGQSNPMRVRANPVTGPCSSSGLLEPSERQNGGLSLEGVPAKLSHPERNWRTT
jgi:hypothetical protein